MPYIKPENVVSPKARWKLIEVLQDNGAGKSAYAIGEWYGNRCIGFRWNGTDNNKIGTPSSRGNATWIVLDSDLYMSIILQLPEDKRFRACEQLEMVVAPDN